MTQNTENNGHETGGTPNQSVRTLADDRTMRIVSARLLIAVAVVFGLIMLFGILTHDIVISLLSAPFVVLACRRAWRFISRPESIPITAQKDPALAGSLDRRCFSAFLNVLGAGIVVVIACLTAANATFGWHSFAGVLLPLALAVIPGIHAWYIVCRPESPRLFH